MGKAKKKKKDFQKVKLKVGKQLKKADNVTTGSFHTRSIQVTQKLKTNDSQPSTKRKLNIQELLTQCQHYSISVRHDALMGLRELLTSYPDLIKSHLAVVLERAASMFIDKDAVVRQAVFRLLKTVLPLISERQITSFFPIISAHLCCCMTHIYDDIQADSLQILDLLLDNFPELVISNSSQLLPNFIEQISCSKSSGDKKRSLTVNPNRKSSSQKWRTSVLGRLHKLLSAMMKYQLKGQTVQGQVSVESRSLLPVSSGKMIVWETDKDAGYFPMAQCFVSRLDLCGVLIRRTEMSTKKTDDKYGVTGEVSMGRFVGVLVPLLLECWVESEGSHHNRNDQGHSGLISQESVGIRESVVHVIQLLWQFVEKNNPTLMSMLHEKYLTDFRNQFLVDFPYSVHQPAERKDKVKRSKQCDQEPSATGLNLALCDIMTHFMSRPASQSSEDYVMLPWESEIFGYLGNVVKEEDLSTEDHHTLLAIMYRLLSRYQNHGCLDELLQEMLVRYTKCHPLSSQRNTLLHFFSVIFTDQRYEAFINSGMAETFMGTLPEAFFQSCSNPRTSEQILTVMKKSVCQSRMLIVATDTVQTFVDQVLDQSSTVFEKLEARTQRMFVELLYVVPSLQESSLSSIVRLCRNPSISLDTCLYMLQIIHQRYMKQTQTVKSHTQYISMLLSVLISPGDSEQNDTVTTCVHRHGDRELHSHFDVEIWTRSLSLIKTVCSTFQQFVNTYQLVKVVGSFLQQYLSRTDRLSSQNLMAIVILANTMNFWKYPIRDQLTKPLCGYIWCLFHVLVENVSVVADFVQELRKECVRVVVETESGVKCFLANMASDCNGAAGEEDIQRILHVVSIVLRGGDRVTTLHKHRGALDDNLTIIKTKFPAVIQKQWWSDFQYLVSLAS